MESGKNPTYNAPGSCLGAGIQPGGNAYVDSLLNCLAIGAGSDALSLP